MVNLIVCLLCLERWSLGQCGTNVLSLSGYGGALATAARSAFAGWQVARLPGSARATREERYMLAGKSSCIAFLIGGFDDTLP